MPVAQPALTQNQCRVQGKQSYHLLSTITYNDLRLEITQMWIPCEIATYIVEYTCDETAYSTEST